MRAASASENVAIIGYAAAPVGRYQPTRDGEGLLEHELGIPVLIEACANAGVDKKDIDALVVANPGEYTRQGYFHTFIAHQLGLKADGAVMQVMGNGMTGGYTLDQAAMQIKSGQARFALAFGVHYESAIPTQDHLDYSIGLTGDVDFQSIAGSVPIAWYAMDAVRYQYEYGVGRDVSGYIAVKNRVHASLNPRAQFRKPISLADVMNARPIVAPLGLLEVPARSDGAVCLVLASEEIALSLRRPYVRLKARGFHHEGIHQMSDEVSDALAYAPLRTASKAAYDYAGLGPADMDLAQLYAPVTIVEALASEAAGFFDRGNGAYGAMHGETSLHGRIPINSCGGCLSRGHPPEVSPLYDFVEACDQLLGHADGRQIADARMALVVSELGKFNAALAYVLERAL
jgi:acetyl-CoA C-acetyltransferase